MKAENEEQILHLIGDALRDGPGSPAWLEATRLVDAVDGEELDALYRVRERLESGKRWRQVRPGVGFTRKLMDAVDQQSDASVRPTGPATIIAILCGLLLLVVIAALVPMLMSRAKAPIPNTDELQNVYFSSPWLQSTFDNSLGGDWQTTGNLPVRAAHGLHADGAGGQWGIISSQSLSSDQFFAFDAKMNVPADGTIGQVFVTDKKNELAAVIDADHVQIMLPGSDMAFSAARPANTAIELKWLIGPASAALEVNGQRIWAGANNLSGDQPRFIGVRFVAHGKTSTAAGVDNIEVRTKG